LFISFCKIVVTENAGKAHGVTVHLQNRQVRLFRRSAAENMEAIIAIAKRNNKLDSLQISVFNLY